MSAGTKKSNCCREVAVVERFKQEVMYGCPPGQKKSDCCREVTVLERFKQEVMYRCLPGQKKVTVVESWPL